MGEVLKYLGVAGADDFGVGELIGEANHEAAEGFVAVEASIVSADSLGWWSCGGHERAARRVRVEDQG